MSTPRWQNGKRGCSSFVGGMIVHSTTPKICRKINSNNRLFFGVSIMCVLNFENFNFEEK